MQEMSHWNNFESDDKDEIFLRSSIPSPLFSQSYLTSLHIPQSLRLPPSLECQLTDSAGIYWPFLTRRPRLKTAMQILQGNLLVSSSWERGVEWVSRCTRQLTMARRPAVQVTLNNVFPLMNCIIILTVYDIRSKTSWNCTNWNIRNVRVTTYQY